MEWRFDLNNLLFLGWTTPQHLQSTCLRLDETLELRTTRNQVEAPITVYFVFPSDEWKFVNFKCTDINSNRWICVIKYCMTDSWATNKPLIGVPRDETKVWRITRTSTSLIIECNGRTVLNFNFATDYMNGFSQCRNTWTRRSEKIKFNWSGGLYKNNGYLLMRKAGKPSKLIDFW